MKEKYKLEIHWSSLEKINDGTCHLIGGYFFGPALKISQQIEPNNFITIDLTPQYSKIISSYYFVKLNWKRVDYVEDKVYLPGSTLQGHYMNEISSLSNEDYIVVDTEDHEEDVHMYNLVYKGQIVNGEGEEHK